jgi:hypothetical protein
MGYHHQQHSIEYAPAPQPVALHLRSAVQASLNREALCHLRPTTPTRLNQLPDTPFSVSRSARQRELIAKA